MYLYIALLLNFGHRNCSDILLEARGAVHLITSQFMAKYDNREDQQISQICHTFTYDAPWSFLLENDSHSLC